MNRGGLQLLVSSVRSRLVRRVLVAALLWAGAAVSLVLALAWTLADAGGWIPGSPVPLVLDLLLVCGGVAGAILVSRWIRTRLREAVIAGRLDRVGGLGRGSVESALELSRTVPPGVSASLVRSSEARVLGSLPADPERLAGELGTGSRSWSRRGGAALAVAAPLLLLLGVTSPDRTASAWGGLLRPTGILATPALPPLGIDPPDGTTMSRGEELTVTVNAPGRERILLVWQFDGDVERRREAPVEDGAALFELGPLEAPVEFEGLAPDGARTFTARVAPLDPLLVTDLQVELVFPPHTGMQVRRIRRELPALEVPAGTRIRIQGRASRTLEAAGIRESSRSPGADGTEPRFALDVEGDRFSGEWSPARGGIYEWDLRAPGDGDLPALPPPIELTLVPDSLPVVAVPIPGRDTVLALSRRQPLVIEARDDYGIGSLDLVAYRVSSRGERGDSVVQGLRTGGARSAVARPVLDVSSWELIPGDTVRYRARIADNAPRPHVVESREYVLRVARRSEAARALQEEMESMTAAVDSLRAEAEEAAREARELERQGVQSRAGEADTRRETASTTTPGQRTEQTRDPEASFEARESMRQALRQRESLLSRADSLRRELTEARRALDDTGLTDEDLRRDLEELETLMEEAADDEEREDARRAAEDAGEMSEVELEAALERLTRDQEEFRRTMEESLDRFRRAAAEQDFRATAREARELADEEDALADAMDQAEESEEERRLRAEQQENLAERAEELQQNLDELAQRLDRIDEDQARSGVEAARDSSERAYESMDRSARMAREERSEDASASARQAADQMERAADGLDQARQDMEQRNEDARRESFRQAVAEALSLARRQSELQERMGDRGGAEREELRGDEAAILEGLRNLSENLSRDGESGEDVDRAAQDASQAVEETLDALEEPRGAENPGSSASRAVEALNRLAEAASQAQQQGQGQQGEQAQPGQQGQQGQQGEQGQGGFRRQLQGLARRQAGLSDQSGTLESMQLGRESLRGRLQRIAGEQGRVAEELGQLSGRSGAGELALGDLRTLAEEAEDLARELDGGRLDPETVRRQERLFHRLLDAGRALENDETSSQREARTAGDVPVVEVEALTDQGRGGTRFDLPDAERMEELLPAQRALVIRYFERLNRSTESSGSVPPASTEPIDGDGAP